MWHRGNKVVRIPKALNPGTVYIILGNTWNVIIIRKLVRQSPSRLRKLGLPTPIGRSIGSLRLIVHSPIREGRKALRRSFIGPLGRAIIVIIPQLFLIRCPRDLIVNLGAFTNTTSKLPPATSPTTNTTIS